MARFVVLVIDSFGVGAMKDVTLVRPQDAGANTCGHILSQLPHLQLPTLEKLGLINALGYAPGDMQPSDSATLGCGRLQHEGGDTFMGHQEILGTRPLPPLRMPFRDVIDRVEQALVSAAWQVERRGEELQFLWVNQAVAIGDNLEADLGGSITSPPISLWSLLTTQSKLVVSCVSRYRSGGSLHLAAC